MVKLSKKTRFFQLNKDGSLGDGLTYTDIPAGTVVAVVNEPPDSKYKTGGDIYLVKALSQCGNLYARIWASDCVDVIPPSAERLNKARKEIRDGDYKVL